jgi:hypothetical protein
MDENPILPARFFFFFPPLLYPKIFPRPTYHLPPPSYLPPTTPTPPSLHRQSLRCSGACVALLCCNAASSGAGFGACVTCYNAAIAASSGAWLRSLLACCGLLAAATQQAPERESLLLQHSKLRSLLQLNPATQQALERLLQ